MDFVHSMLTDAAQQGVEVLGPDAIRGPMGVSAEAVVRLEYRAAVTEATLATLQGDAFVRRALGLRAVPEASEGLDASPFVPRLGAGEGGSARGRPGSHAASSAEDLSRAPSGLLWMRPRATIAEGSSSDASAAPAGPSSDRGVGPSTVCGTSLWRCGAAAPPPDWPCCVGGSAFRVVQRRGGPPSSSAGPSPSSAFDAAMTTAPPWLDDDPSLLGARASDVDVDIDDWDPDIDLDMSLSDSDRDAEEEGDTLVRMQPGRDRVGQHPWAPRSMRLSTPGSAGPSAVPRERTVWRSRSPSPSPSSSRSNASQGLFAAPPLPAWGSPWGRAAVHEGWAEADRAGSNTWAEAADSRREATAPRLSAHAPAPTSRDRGALAVAAVTHARAATSPDAAASSAASGARASPSGAVDSRIPHDRVSTTAHARPSVAPPSQERDPSAGCLPRGWGRGNRGDHAEEGGGRGRGASGEAAPNARSARLRRVFDGLLCGCSAGVEASRERAGDEGVSADHVREEESATVRAGPGSRVRWGGGRRGSEGEAWARGAARSEEAATLLALQRMPDDLIERVLGVALGEVRLWSGASMADLQTVLCHAPVTTVDLGGQHVRGEHLRLTRPGLTLRNGTLTLTGGMVSVRSSSGDLRSWKCGLLVAARGCTMAGVDVRCQGWASALVTSLWNPWSYHADTAVRTAAVMVLAPEATLTACRILNSKGNGVVVRSPGASLHLLDSLVCRSACAGLVVFHEAAAVCQTTELRGNEGGAVVAGAGSHLALLGCGVRKCQWYGVSVREGAACFMRFCHVDDCRGSGGVYSAGPGSHVTAVGCSVRGGSGSGARVEAGGELSLLGCRVSHVDGHGLSCKGWSTLVTQGGSVRWCHLSGVYVRGGGEAVLRGTSVEGTAASGVSVMGRGSTVALDGVRIVKAARHAIHAQGACTALVQGSVALRPGECGVRAQGEACRVELTDSEILSAPVAVSAACGADVSAVRCRMVRSKSTAVQSAGEGTSVDLDACAFEECREPCVLADSAGTVSLRNWDVGQQRRRKWRWGRRVRVACERRGGRVHAGGAAL